MTGKTVLGIVAMVFLTGSGEAGVKKVLFGGGCFWGIEYAFSRLDGVKDSVSGYSGGHVEDPEYKEVCTDTTGHAEVVEVTYDEEKISFGELLEFFFKVHDPTQLNRQGPDYGTQYRSVIYTTDDGQLKEALEYKSRLERSGRYTRPVVTEIAPASEFYRAEDYHQDYVIRTGRGCHINLDFLGKK